MASNHLPPVESIISGETEMSGRGVHHHHHASSLHQSESQMALVNHEEDPLTSQSDTDSNPSPREAATSSPPQAARGGTPPHHQQTRASISSIEVLNNNKQDPIQINRDIVTAVQKHTVHPHYIGYHPERLFKVKGKLHNSEGVAFLPEDRMVVADKHDGHVMLYDREGRLEKMLVKGVKPCGVATNRGGTIAFTDTRDRKGKVVKVYTDDGTQVTEFGNPNGWKPRGIAVSNKGLLIVTDLEPKNHSVGIYTLHGKLMSKFGKKGDGKEELGEPLYVYVDIKDRILISDRSHHCIKVFSEKGIFLGKIGHHGSGPGALLNPRGITEDAYGHILVCDTGNRRVSAFSHEGHFIKHLLQATDGVAYPVDIAFNKVSGRLAVTMHKANGDFHKLRVYQLPNIEAIQKLH